MREQILALERVIAKKRQSRRVNLPSVIEEGLFLGSLEAAKSKEELHRLNITHILTVANYINPLYPNEFVYKVIGVSDRSNTDLKRYFDECVEFIDAAKRSGGGVLVHCFAGKSRSVTIVVAYLMNKHGMSKNEALEHVKSKRPIASPNSGFLSQLEDFENSLLVAGLIRPRLNGRLNGLLLNLPPLPESKVLLHPPLVGDNTASSSRPPLAALFDTEGILVEDQMDMLKLSRKRPIPIERFGVEYSSQVEKRLKGSTPKVANVCDLSPQHCKGKDLIEEGSLPPVPFASAPPPAVPRFLPGSRVGDSSFQVSDVSEADISRMLALPERFSLACQMIYESSFLEDWQASQDLEAVEGFRAVVHQQAKALMTSLAVLHKVEATCSLGQSASKSISRLETLLSQERELSNRRRKEKSNLEEKLTIEEKKVESLNEALVEEKRKAAEERGRLLILGRQEGYEEGRQAGHKEAIEALKATEEFETLKDTMFLDGGKAIVAAIKDKHPEWDLGFLYDSSEDEATADEASITQCVGDGAAEDAEKNAPIAPET